MDQAGSPGYSGVSTISGGVGPYTLTSATGLPAGLKAALTGDTPIYFTGAPTAANSYDANITIRDAAGASIAKTFAIKINAALALGKLTTTQWTVNKPDFPGTLAIAGGTGSFVISNLSGLPTGLTAVVIGNKIRFSGTPNAAQTFAEGSITLQDAGGASVTRTFNVTINPSLQIMTLSLPSITAGVLYHAPVQAVGGTGVLAFTITAGALPPGLKLSRAGVISGVSRRAGVYSFTITATDAIGDTFTEGFTLSLP